MEAAGGSGVGTSKDTDGLDNLDGIGDKGLVEQLSVIQQYVSKIPAPPNDGCICYCARTGFCSSQGKLVRLIEVSQTTTVRGDTRDTVLLLLFLLVFALIASGYVLHRGMQDGTRSRYQLLLHCILIVTSVIPPELPMQTALAVNNSLMTLMKMQMFCTEPFRVPMAGKVDTCVFDKTGTLTTDELVAVGIVPATTRVETLVQAFNEAMEKVTENVKKTAAAPTPVRQQMQQRKLFGLIPYGPPVAVNAGPGIPIIKDTVSVAGAGMHSMSADVHTTAAAVLVLGGCHSLVLIDDKMGGDPLEEASMKAVKWELHKKVKDISRPTSQSVAEKPFQVCIPASGGGIGVTSKLQVDYIKILARHHFSSKLQRMSVVVRVGTPGGVDGGLILVKGSPEMIATMCVNIPSDYHEVSRNLARRGMRVIALAWRRISNEQIAPCCESRLEVEKDLIFVGFVSFMCRVRKDSASVVHQLREGGNTVAMATGDAILTGIHVAKEVGITTPSKKGILLLECILNEHEKPTGLKWANFDNSEEHSAKFDADAVAKLSVDYDLCASGQSISYALDQYTSVISKILHLFVVYARMRPDEKERVLVLMKENKRVTLMCGDGANDVGALRQAHVGIALLSGFGDLNGVKDNKDDKGDKDSLSVTGGDKKKPEGFMGAITAAADAAKAKQAQAQNANQRKISPELEAKLNALVINESDDDLFLKVKTSELHRRLRLIGVEPNDFPSITEKTDVIVLYKQSVKDKSVEYKDILKQRRFAKMTPRVSLYVCVGVLGMYVCMCVCCVISLFLIFSEFHGYVPIYRSICLYIYLCIYLIF